MKLDTKCTSKPQRLAQEQLHLLLEASACYDHIDQHGGVDKLGKGTTVQKATAQQAAIKRGIEILSAANTDAECAEAVLVVAGIIDAIEGERQLQ